MATNRIAAQTEDPFLWLEDIHGKQSMDWVKQHNAATEDLLSKLPEYQQNYDLYMQAMNSKERITYPNIYGGYIYNFRLDKDHERGVWRRALKQGVVEGNPQWETLIDVDQLYRAENLSWASDYEGLFPSFSRFLVYLTRGGGDANVIREFDTSKKAFIDEGFSLPESKGWVKYLDEDTLLVARDFGEGTLTTSGYPRQVRLWKRGGEIKDAPVIHQGESTDVTEWPKVYHTPERDYAFIIQRRTFFTQHTYAYERGELIRLDIPDDASIEEVHKGQLVIKLQSDWEIDQQVFHKGSVISTDYLSLLQGECRPELIIRPNDKSTVEAIIATRNRLLVGMLENIKSRLFAFTHEEHQWNKALVSIPEYGAARLLTWDVLSDEFYFLYQDFLTPTSLYFADAAKTEITQVQALPALFDARNYRTWQYWARSKDGTMVPYFVVGASDMKMDGSNPTILTAYGGFGGSMTPYYISVYGPSWLDRGGVFVLGNTRGGGEFGPAWHEAGMKEKRQNVHDDFIAISEDLIARGITSPSHLGIAGGSGGALLVGAAFTQRPELFRAAVCMVPLMDMQRYNKLLAGASWMAEYGNPDVPEEWAYISKYSPYHNLKAGVKYPAVLFMASSTDDRVHPGHARKMAAKMESLGHKAYLYEATEGGHGGTSAAKKQMVKYSSLIQTFFVMNLG